MGGVLNIVTRSRETTERTLKGEVVDEAAVKSRAKLCTAGCRSIDSEFYRSKISGCRCFGVSIPTKAATNCSFVESHLSVRDETTAVVHLLHVILP